jgi:hypothetical protein
MVFDWWTSIVRVTMPLSTGRGTAPRGRPRGRRRGRRWTRAARPRASSRRLRGALDTGEHRATARAEARVLGFGRNLPAAVAPAAAGPAKCEADSGVDLRFAAAVRHLASLDGLRDDEEVRETRAFGPSGARSASSSGWSARSPFRSRGPGALAENHPSSLSFVNRSQGASRNGIFGHSSRSRNAPRAPVLLSGKGRRTPRP